MGHEEISKIACREENGKYYVRYILIKEQFFDIVGMYFGAIVLKNSVFYSIARKLSGAFPFSSKRS